MLFYNNAYFCPRLLNGRSGAVLESLILVSISKFVKCWSLPIFFRSSFVLWTVRMLGGQPEGVQHPETLECCRASRSILLCSLVCVCLCIYVCDSLCVPLCVHTYARTYILVCVCVQRTQSPRKAMGYHLKVPPAVGLGGEYTSVRGAGTVGSQGNLQFP